MKKNPKDTADIQHIDIKGIASFVNNSLHIVEIKNKKMTNHERVLAGRANKMGLTVDQYKIVIELLKEETWLP